MYSNTAYSWKGNQLICIMHGWEKIDLQSTNIVTNYFTLSTDS